MKTSFLIFSIGPAFAGGCIYIYIYIFCGEVVYFLHYLNEKKWNIRLMMQSMCSNWLDFLIWPSWALPMMQVQKLSFIPGLFRLIGFIRNLLKGKKEQYVIHQSLFYYQASTFCIHILVGKIFSLVTKQQTPAIRIRFVAKAWLEKSSVKV